MVGCLKISGRRAHADVFTGDRAKCALDGDRVPVGAGHEASKRRPTVLPLNAHRGGAAPAQEPVERVLGGRRLVGHLLELGEAVLQRRVEHHRTGLCRERLGVVGRDLGAVGEPQPADLVSPERLRRPRGPGRH